MWSAAALCRFSTPQPSAVVSAPGFPKHGRISLISNPGFSWNTAREHEIAGGPAHSTGEFILSGCALICPSTSILPMQDGPSKSIPWPHAPPHRLGATGTYMVTAATYHKLHHFRGRERLAVLHRGLLKMAVHYGWTLEAWAVFSNHYHFIGRSPETPETLKPMLKTLHVKLAGWVNRLDQTPGRKVWYQYRETLLTHEKSYLARLHYVHQNPVRHGLTDHATTYSWCSAGWFERIATPAMVKTLYGFKTDQINVDDDYEVSPDW